MRRDDRPGLWMAGYWSTVGGAIEPGETPPQAALREAEEELGQRPDKLVFLGFVEGARHRIHLFASRVAWSLDEMIAGEGQGVDWLSPAQIERLQMVEVLVAPVHSFLASECYRELAAGAPPADDPAPPLPDGFAGLLGLKRGDLLVVRGAPAGFVRRLWDVLDGARVTASPADWERAAAVLWWPRGEPAEPALLELAATLIPGGALWLAGPSEATLAPALAAARRLRRAPSASLALPPSDVAVRLTADSAWASH